MQKRALKVTLLVLGVLVLVSVLWLASVPCLNCSYSTRAKLTEGLDLASGARIAMAEYFRDHQGIPQSNAEAGLGTELIRGKYVRDIRIICCGRLNIVYGGEGEAAELNGMKIEMSMHSDDWEHFEWRCRSRGIEMRDLPGICKNIYDDSAPLLLTIAIWPGFKAVGEGPDLEYDAEAVSYRIARAFDPDARLAIAQSVHWFELEDAHEFARALNSGLGIDFYVDGSVEFADSTMRIIVELFDILEDGPIWQGVYTADTSELFDDPDKSKTAAQIAADIYAVITD